MASGGSVSSSALDLATRTLPSARNRIAVSPSGGCRSYSPRISSVFGRLGGTACGELEHAGTRSGTRHPKPTATATLRMAERYPMRGGAAAAQLGRAADGVVHVGGVEHGVRRAMGGRCGADQRRGGADQHHALAGAAAPLI